MAKTEEHKANLAKSEVALEELQNKLAREETEKRQHMEYKQQLEAKVGPYVRKLFWVGVSGTTYLTPAHWHH